MERAGAAWKGFDWSAMDRLHHADLISNPAKRVKSVYLTAEGAAKGERLFRELFARGCVSG